VRTHDHQRRPFLDVMAEDMMASLERNVRDFGLRFAGLEDQRQGIVHVIGPELGLTQPGMTIACGDSHTSTHGAFGSVRWTCLPLDGRANFTPFRFHVRQPAAQSAKSVLRARW
jgi:hypothetical protein